MLKHLTTLKKTCVYLPVYDIVKDIIKDRDEQPEKEVKGKVRKGPQHRSCSACGAGVRHPPTMWGVHLPEAL